jgi:hypothetical protein
MICQWWEEKSQPAYFTVSTVAAIIRRPSTAVSAAVRGISGLKGKPPFRNWLE